MIVSAKKSYVGVDARSSRVEYHRYKDSRGTLFPFSHFARMQSFEFFTISPPLIKLIFFLSYARETSLISFLFLDPSFACPFVLIIIFTSLLLRALFRILFFFLCGDFSRYFVSFFEEVLMMFDECI